MNRYNNAMVAILLSFVGFMQAADLEHKKTAAYGAPGTPRPETPKTGVSAHDLAAFDDQNTADLKKMCDEYMQSDSSQQMQIMNRFNYALTPTVTDSKKLRAAVREKDHTLAQSLIEHNASIHDRGSDGFNCLMIAIMNRDAYMVDLLLSVGARVTDLCPRMATHEITTVLGNQVSKQHKKLITEDGETVLMLAAREGDSKIFDLILQAIVRSPVKDTLLNYSDEVSGTALHIASRWGHADIVQMLLKVDANLQHAWFEGLTPYGSAQQARALGNTKALDVIKVFNTIDPKKYLNLNEDELVPSNYKAPVSTNPRASKFFENTSKNILELVIVGSLGKVARILKQCPEDINAVDEQNRTPLMFAIVRGNEKMVQFLLRSSLIDLNQRSERGFTALMYAVAMKNPVFVELLMKAGADVTIQDAPGNSGKTALQHAKDLPDTSAQEKETIIKLLS